MVCGLEPGGPIITVCIGVETRQQRDRHLYTVDTVDIIDIIDTIDTLDSLVTKDGLPHQSSSHQILTMCSLESDYEPIEMILHARGCQHS